MPEVIIVTERDPRGRDRLEPGVSCRTFAASRLGRDDDPDSWVRLDRAEGPPRVAVVDNNDLDFDIDLTEDRADSLRELDRTVVGRYDNTNGEVHAVFTIVMTVMRIKAFRVDSTGAFHWARRSVHGRHV
jgi:hypothetical protein